jgi:hypothetical protein
MDELDDDLIVENFAIHVNDCRISAKQEKKKLAWSILDKEVSLQSTVENRKRAIEESIVTKSEHVVKRTKVDHDDTSKSIISQVTPLSSTTRNNELVAHEEKINHESMEEDNIDASTLPNSSALPHASTSDVSTSPVKSKNLDSVFKSADRPDEVKDDKKKDTNSMESGTAQKQYNELTNTGANDNADDIDNASTVDRLNEEISMNQCQRLMTILRNLEPQKLEPEKPEDSRSKSSQQNIGTQAKETKDVFFRSADETNINIGIDLDGKPDEVKDDEQKDTDGMESEATKSKYVDFENLGANDDDDDDDDNSDASTVDLLNMDSNEDYDDSMSNIDDSPKKLEPQKLEPEEPQHSRSKSSEKNKGTLTDECKETVQKSRSVLESAKKILEENELFCSKDRRDEWLKEISGLLNNIEPKTVIGVLGNTGVGKSSLLNALLDEASVLPTSGSRGCTAAVVELRFNSDMEKENTDGNEVACYRGDVEFMTLQEWQTELKILVDECSTHEKTVYALEPDPQSAAEAAAAWTKIDQVYGKGTMRRFVRQSSATVFRYLANDFRVRRLLTAQPDSGKQYNVISVSEGSVIPGSDEAMRFLANHKDMNRKSRRTRNKWAKDFREKINSYVYRKGNGEQAQTWPLIRKVVLHGPWACLSTGACLVDLPGVRDANAARAKVAEQYLQHCSQIWVVAPIKRAVDDGTAKELLGEQFKRRLLMDGQYGNVSFICTQTVSVLL